MQRLNTPAILFRNGTADAAEAKSLLCTVVQSIWPVSDKATLDAALAAADIAREQGKCVVFALDYEVGALLEPAVKSPHVGDNAAAAPIGYIWVFSEAVWLTQEQADAWLLERAADMPAGCVRGSAELSPEAYANKLGKIRQAIADGEIYQVNYTFPLDVTLYGDPAKVFLNLAQAQPTAYAAYIDMPEYQVLSLSPELFFAVEGDRIRVRPMKGTSSRCVEHEVDQAQAQALKASEKNRAENLMIVDLLRNDLGRVAKPGSVVVESLFDIEAYATVHQMTSTISATLETTRFTDLITALFPCGSITGAPKVAAMQKIDAWETAPRGLYTGTIGWAISEKIQANVAIRTLVLDPPTGDSLAARTGVLGVGSGIVWDSNAEAEYAECLLKSDFLVKPDPGFTLFETLRLELPAAELEATLPLVEIYPRYRGHRARLSAAAFSLGFAFNEAAFESMLWQVKAEIREKANGNAGLKSYRVRIDLGHDGVFHASWSALPPVADRVALIWATERLDGSNPLLRYKTSARSVYDAAIETAVSQQAFDALFCNHAGLVCEGGRSNVFVKEGNRLLTPPVRCGLLPGVLRAELLSRGEASESLLTIADIKAASREGRLRVGNALRGLMPAYLK
ncbi:MAG: aminodeoxychorismate synthase component I [Fluviibacter sp.]